MEELKQQVRELSKRLDDARAQEAKAITKNTSITIGSALSIVCACAGAVFVYYEGQRTLRAEATAQSKQQAVEIAKVNQAVLLLQQDIVYMRQSLQNGEAQWDRWVTKNAWREWVRQCNEWLLSTGIKLPIPGGD